MPNTYNDIYQQCNTFGMSTLTAIPSYTRMLISIISANPAYFPHEKEITDDTVAALVMALDLDKRTGVRCFAHSNWVLQLSGIFKDYPVTNLESMHRIVMDEDFWLIDIESKRSIDRLLSALIYFKSLQSFERNFSTEVKIKSVLGRNKEQAVLFEFHSEEYKLDKICHDVLDMAIKNLVQVWNSTNKNKKLGEFLSALASSAANGGCIDKAAMQVVERYMFSNEGEGSYTLEENPSVEDIAPQLDAAENISFFEDLMFVYLIRARALLIHCGLEVTLTNLIELIFTAYGNTPVKSRLTDEVFSNVTSIDRASIRAYIILSEIGDIELTVESIPTEVFCRVNAFPGIQERYYLLRGIERIASPSEFSAISKQASEYSELIKSFNGQPDSLPKKWVYELYVKPNPENLVLQISPSQSLLDYFIDELDVAIFDPEILKKNRRLSSSLDRVLVKQIDKLVAKALKNKDWVLLNSLVPEQFPQVYCRILELLAKKDCLNEFERFREKISRPYNPQYPETNAMRYSLRSFIGKNNLAMIQAIYDYDSESINISVDQRSQLTYALEDFKVTPQTFCYLLNFPNINVNQSDKSGLILSNYHLRLEFLERSEMVEKIMALISHPRVDISQVYDAICRVFSINPVLLERFQRQFPLKKIVDQFIENCRLGQSYTVDQLETWAKLFIDFLFETESSEMVYITFAEYQCNTVLFQDIEVIKCILDRLFHKLLLLGSEKCKAAEKIMLDLFNKIKQDKQQIESFFQKFSCHRESIFSILIKSDVSIETFAMVASLANKELFYYHYTRGMAPIHVAIAKNRFELIEFFPIKNLTYDDLREMHYPLALMNLAASNQVDAVNHLLHSGAYALLNPYGMNEDIPRFLNKVTDCQSYEAIKIICCDYFYPEVPVARRYQNYDAALLKMVELDNQEQVLYLLKNTPVYNNLTNNGVYDFHVLSIQRNHVETLKFIRSQVEPNDKINLSLNGKPDVVMIAVVDLVVRYDTLQELLLIPRIKVDCVESLKRGVHNKSSILYKEKILLLQCYQALELIVRNDSLENIKPSVMTGLNIEKNKEFIVNLLASWIGKRFTDSSIERAKQKIVSCYQNQQSRSRTPKALDLFGVFPSSGQSSAGPSNITPLQ